MPFFVFIFSIIVAVACLTIITGLLLHFLENDSKVKNNEKENEKLEF